MSPVQMCLDGKKRDRLGRVIRGKRKNRKITPIPDSDMVMVDCANGCGACHATRRRYLSGLCADANAVHALHGIFAFREVLEVEHAPKGQVSPQRGLSRPRPPPVAPPSCPMTFLRHASPRRAAWYRTIRCANAHESQRCPFQKVITTCLPAQLTARALCQAHALSTPQ